MWWYYEKRFENDEYIDYAYSRENRDLDGLVRLNKRTQEATVLKACLSDSKAPYDAKDALEFLYLLQREGFPERKQVACG